MQKHMHGVQTVTDSQCQHDLGLSLESMQYLSSVWREVEKLFERLKVDEVTDWLVRVLLTTDQGTHVGTASGVQPCGPGPPH